MVLVTRQHESGLVLAESAAVGEAGLRRALKRLDDRLVLWPPDAFSPYWRVLRRVSDDRPAESVLVWMDDDGTARPLSSGIVEAVERLRRDGRGRGPSVDERNRMLEDAVKAERELAREAIHDEYAPYLERGRVGVGFGAKNKVPYWMRKSRGGYVE